MMTNPGADQRLGARAHKRVDGTCWRPTLERIRAGGGRSNCRLDQTAGALRGVRSHRSSGSKAPRRANAPAAGQAYVSRIEVAA